MTGSLHPGCASLGGCLSSHLGGVVGSHDGIGGVHDGVGGVHLGVVSSHLVVSTHAVVGGVHLGVGGVHLVVGGTHLVVSTHCVVGGIHLVVSTHCVVGGIHLVVSTHFVVGDHSGVFQSGRRRLSPDHLGLSSSEVNFINILHADFMRTDPKGSKNDSQVISAFLNIWDLCVLKLSIKY
jgi:hypothetical protein